MIQYVPFNLFSVAHKEYYDRLRLHVTSDLVGIVAMLNDAVVGMVCLDNWTDNSCQAHISISNAMCLRPDGLVHRTVQYVYDFNDREIIYGLVRSDNPKAVEFDKRLGFKIEHTLKDAFEPGVDNIIMSMRKNDCNYYTPYRRAA